MTFYNLNCTTIIFNILVLLKLLYWILYHPFAPMHFRTSTYFDEPFRAITGSPEHDAPPLCQIFLPVPFRHPPWNGASPSAGASPAHSPARHLCPIYVDFHVALPHRRAGVWKSPFTLLGRGLLWSEAVSLSNWRLPLHLKVLSCV